MLELLTNQMPFWCIALYNEFSKAPKSNVCQVQLMAIENEFVLKRTGLPLCTVPRGHKFVPALSSSRTPLELFIAKQRVLMFVGPIRKSNSSCYDNHASLPTKGNLTTQLNHPNEFSPLPPKGLGLLPNQNHPLNI